MNKRSDKEAGVSRQHTAVKVGDDRKILQGQQAKLQKKCHLSVEGV